MAFDFDGLLQSIGVRSYEDLTPDERKTYQDWYEIMNTRAIEKEDIVNFNLAIKRGIEKELVSPDTSEKRRQVLLARLENCVMWEEFLSTPERARKALENHMGSLKTTANRKLF